MADVRDHWEDVYKTKAETAVSWYQPQSARSLAWIASVAGPAAPIIDVGGGASTLVDDLLANGFSDVTVLDVAEAALAKSKARLGARAGEVSWIVADITKWCPERRYEVWHDRAVFHFLTEDAQQAAYVAALTAGTAPGATVVIEECMFGPEVSFFALCDGETALPFGSAQDHKRAYDGDEGPNTGGMGTFSPSPLMTPEMEKQVMDTIILPSLAGMKQDGIPFTGVLFAGLMLTAQGPKLLEYNTRFGDPETQVLMRRLKSDLGLLLKAGAEGRLKDMKVELAAEAAVCVVYAAKGYPGDYVKNTEIRKLKEAGKLANVKIFHAGTAVKDGKVLATGGRVLGVTATGKDFAVARQSAYTAVDAIDWPDGFYRRDIGGQ
ncbi:MAG: phosphoribosylamine--glycine ligase [Alphaproteobacteria bacterium]|nr:phosphoribosylamine--glycine ligase [Alphaproteobacteria bacterium]